MVLRYLVYNQMINFKHNGRRHCTILVCVLAFPGLHLNFIVLKDGLSVMVKSGTESTQ
jgi:hypothetical protein